MSGVEVRGSSARCTGKEAAVPGVGGVRRQQVVTSSGDHGGRWAGLPA